MRLKLTILLGAFIMLLSGCSVKEVHVKGLKQEEAKNYPFLMVSNTDIVCNTGRLKLITQKDTIFKPNDLSEVKFYSTTEGKLIRFPKNSIFLKSYSDTLSSVGISIGYLVYPDGQFVYDNYKMVMITNNGSTMVTMPNQLREGECIQEGKTVFTPTRKE